jgi:hypothetical protein
MNSVQPEGGRRSAGSSGPRDGLPPPLEGVLALAEGADETAGSFLAPDVQAWLASPEQGLAATIDAVRGRRASAEALAHLSPSSLTVVAAMASDGACWAEITCRGGGGPETCLAGLTYDSRGAVSRLVWLRAPLVPASGIDEEACVADGRPVLERYFTDLMSSRFREAAAHFTPDTIYSHPPYAGGTERVLLHGRDALWRGFVTERGPSPARQIITDCRQRGGRVFVEGVIEGIPDGGTFFSTAQITPQGEIARYVAFYSATRVPRATPPR